MKKIVSLLMMSLLCVTAWAETVSLHYTGTTTTNMTGSNDAELFGLDVDTWSVVGSKGASANYPILHSDGMIYLDYSASGGNTLNVSLLNGAKINSISLTLEDANMFGNAIVKVDGTIVAGSNGVYQINSSSFVISNGNTSAHPLQIRGITIDYEAAIAAVATPVITLNPANGPYYEGTTVTAHISCATDGALIYYSRDGSEWTLGNSLTVTTTTTIRARAVYLDQESAVASKTVTFVPPVITVNSIAEFNALPDNTELTFAGEVVVIARKDDNFYVQDESKGMLINGHTGYGYNQGEVLTNFKGRKTTSHGAPELIPISFGTTGRYAAVTSVELTPSQVNLENVFRYAVIKRAEIKNGNIVVGDESVALYNHFGVELPSADEDKLYDIVGVTGYYDAPRFMPLSFTVSPEPKYTITVAELEHGRVTPNVSEAEGGTIVTLVVTPDYGYELERLTYVCDPNTSGESVVIENNQFQMPASNVIVSAIFKLKTFNIAVASDITNGTVTVKDGKTTATMDETISLVVTPAKGYKLENLIVTHPAAGGAGQGTITPVLGDDGYYSFSMPGADVTVNATFALQDYTISLGEGIEHGTVTFEPTTAHMGQTISVTATPEDGFELASLEYEYTEDTGSPKRVAIENNQFVMPASDVTILATFRAKIYNIATSVNPEGAGTIIVPATAAYQSEVEVTVTPAAGYQLKEMYYTYDAGGGVHDPIFTIEDGRFIMPGTDITIVAEFELKAFTIEVSPNIEHGTVTTDKTAANMGETITVTVTPDEGYQLKSLFYVEDAGSVTAEHHIQGGQFVMPAQNVLLVAEFELATYAINISQTENGTVTADLTQANMGQTVTLTVTPDERYELQSITVTTVENLDDTPAAAPRMAPQDIELTKIDEQTYTFVMPASAVNVNATFKQESVTAIDGIHADGRQGLLYVNPMGQVSDRPFKGINIVIDGDKTYKLVK